MSKEKVPRKKAKQLAIDDWPVIREIKGKGGKITFMVDTCGWLEKRERPIEKTRQQAEIRAEQYRIDWKNKGTDGFKLSNTEREDAHDALAVCRRLGFKSLVDAMARLEKLVDPGAGDITLQDLRLKFLEYYKGRMAKKKVSPSQYETTEQRSASIVELLGVGQSATAITPRGAWDPLLARGKERNWSPRTLARYCTVARQMFDFGVKTKHLGENPLEHPDLEFEMETAMEPAAQEAPQLLTIDQATDLLVAAYEQNDQRGLLAYTAICLFTGARPLAEASKLTWEDVEWEEGVIHIRGDKSKNNSSQRTLEMCGTLMDWLSRCDRSKPLIPNFNRNQMEYNWKKVRASAKTPHVIDLTRHSFASYSYSIHKDKLRLQGELGHTTGQMLKHYLEVSTGRKKDAVLYFGLTPAKVLGVEDNVIRMVEAG